MNRILKLGMIVLFAVLLTACGNDTAKSDTKESKEKETVSIPKEKEFEEKTKAKSETFENDTLSLQSGSKIKLISTVVTEDYFSDKTLFGILFSYENNTDEPQSIGDIPLINFSMAQNTGDTTETLYNGIPPEDFKFQQEYDNSKKSVNAGKTVKSIVLYELANTKGELTLTINDDFGKNIGTKEYKLK